MRKSTIVILLILVLVCVVALAGCEGAKTYYNESNNYEWIRFGRGDWSDSAGNSGEYERDRSGLRFYLDDVEVFTGTLKHGTFTKKVNGITVGVYRTPEARAALEKEKG